MDAAAHPQERITFSRLPELPGAVLFKIENSGTLWRWHHETYTVAAMYDGGGEWVCDSKVHTLTAGNLSLWEPGDLHVVTRLYPRGRRALPLTTQRVVLIDPNVIENAAMECGVPHGKLHLRGRSSDVAPFFRAFLKLHQECERPGTTLERESLYARCVRLFLDELLENRRPAVRGKSEREAVRRAMAYLRERFSENVRLEKLAQVAAISKFSLLRAFSTDIGIPPHVFQIQLRLSRARELLSRKVPAALVAAEVGFADQSHLIYHFRRSMGTTPGAFAGSTSG